MDGDEFERVQSETLDHARRESLTPAEYERLKSAVFSESFHALLASETSYFVLGNYDDGPREARLELVAERLSARGDESYAFLMKDVPEGWDLWTAKFEVLASRADYLVPVLEDNHGSHHWEVGRIAAPAYRPKVHALKRAYGSEEREHERFDAMVADFLDVLDRDGRVCFWREEADLRECVDGLPA